MDTVSLAADQVIEGGLPIYGPLSLLTAERHGDLALVPRPAFAFAAAHPVVPLTVEEFERAALDYPIVFFGAQRRAFAVTGLAPARNAFIDDAGRYCAGAYVPAYLRRYPFALVRDPERGLWVLALDEAAAALCPADTAGARALFDSATPTDATREVLALCQGYEEAQQRTAALVEALDDLDLFETRQAHHRPRRADGTLGEPTLLLDYAAVDRARLEALDDDALARLRRLGALGPLYAHLMSAANWDRLALIGEA